MAAIPRGGETMKYDLAYYESEIRQVGALLEADPTNEKLRRQLNYRLDRYLDLSEIVVLVAGNEQKPWTTEELGFRTTRMPQKSEIGYDQVADYQALVNGQICPLLLERKEVADLYGTLFSGDNRARFYREIQRFRDDERFDQMVIIVEGSMMEFLWYEPAKTITNPKYHRGVPPKKVSADQKLASVAKLYSIGVPVWFTESRHFAVQAARHLIRQSAKKEIKNLFL